MNQRLWCNINVKLYLVEGEQTEDPFDFDDLPTPPPRTRRNRRRVDSDSSDSDSDSEEEKDALKQAKTKVEELKVDETALLRAAAGNDFKKAAGYNSAHAWTLRVPDQDLP